MDITETRSDGVVRLALNGRLDGTSSPAFEERILTLIDAGERRLIVDLAHLDFISSVGLRAFVVAARALHPMGGRIVLCALQPSIRQLFDLTGFWASLTIVTTCEEAAGLFPG
jgi:anti-anti-sigma factor